ncbi:MAG: nitroreductase/quinone reductase family protein, partial [Chloroflexota bacterium]
MSGYNQELIDDLRAHGGHASTGNWVGRQVLILTTRGAKTGEPRETPLAYVRDGDRIVIVASKGGAPSHAAWYHNIMAHPRVT